MGRDRAGLIVGIAFIVLFVAILGFRVKAQANEHAIFPTGESKGHRILTVSHSRHVEPWLATAKESPEETPAEAPSPGDDQGAVVPVAEETPVETPAPAIPPRHDRVVYTVRANDSLVAIAKRFYGADGARLWKKIYEANTGVIDDPDVLVPGQKIVIPGARPEPSREPGREPGAMLAGRPMGGTYTVQPNETFYKIARKLYGKAETGKLLWELNKDRVPDPRKLQPGQTIRLPQPAGGGAETVVAMAR